MSSSMTWHDRRLAGNAPNIAPNTFIVDQNFELRHALSWIRTYARNNGGLRDLNVMCHGLAGPVHDSVAGVSTYTEGFGLQICKESLTFDTIQQISVLNGLVDVITLYACGPANTRRGFANTRADGQRFCSELAAYANAEVVAPSETQWYSRVGGTPNASDGTIDFGAWEGSVYRFYPDGTISRHN
jgi:hypothetical protein